MVKNQKWLQKFIADSRAREHASDSMSIEEAFAGFDAQTGDLVKSQTAFAMYDQYFGWVGSFG